MPGFTFPAVGPLDLGSPPYRSEYTDHRYYDPLRLPNVHLGFVRSSLSSPDTLFAPLLSLAGQVRAPLPSAWISPHWLTGTRQPDCCNTRKTSGSPEFPSYPHEHMPWSQTPAVPRTLAISLPGLLPSTHWIVSAFILQCRTYPNGPQLYIFRGSIHSLHP